MTEVLLIIKDFTVNNPDLITWLVAAFIIVLGILLQSFWIKEYICEWQLNHLLKNISSESLHNITIPDGMDDKVFIEHLILMPKKIILLGVKKYRGLIFAADKIDLWTQVIGNKSYKFENPLRQLENDAVVLNSKVKNTKIEEKVLFIKGSEFPKGKPDNIVTISDIKEWKSTFSKEDISDVIRADWKELVDVSAANDLTSQGVLLDEENASGLNMFSLVTIIITLAIWLVWRLM